MSKDALVTAFTTGNLFVVLAVLTDNCKKLFEKYNLSQKKTDTYIDVIVPISFNFPTTGKLIMLLFILFGTWFSGHHLSLHQYPTFEFADLERIRQINGIMIAVPKSVFVQERLQNAFSKAEFVPLNSLREFFEITTRKIDALLLDAQAGSAWTLLYPDYQPVVPKPGIYTIPRAYPVAGRDPDMANFISQWIELKKKTPDCQRLYQ